jgi:hypothetical protein
MGKLATRLNTPVMANRPAVVVKTSTEEIIGVQDHSCASQMLGNQVDWQALVDRVRKGSVAGMAELYRLLDCWPAKVNELRDRRPDSPPKGFWYERKR